MRIGVDVGGTNTDAVLMDGKTVLAATKSPTTEDVSSGIIAAIKTVLGASKRHPKDIQVVMIGTTHFTNAFVEAKRLLEVGIVRLSLPSASGIPPLSDWPERLKAAVGNHIYEVAGGYQFDGRENAPLDEAARSRLAEVHERSLHELEEGLSPDLVAELRRITLPFSEDGSPSEAELRVAQAQLVGWLEGLFHGIQATLFAQQMAAQQQLANMRGQIGPGGRPMPGRPMPERDGAGDRPGTYL